MKADGLLIDIDGVLTVSWQPIAGAAEAFERLVASGTPYRLITNTTTRTTRAIASALGEAGFDVAPDRILTAPAATAAYLRAAHPGRRCFLLSSGDIRDDLDGIDIVDGLGDADVVVLGGAGLVYTYDQLNHAFRLLLDGAAFVAMHRNLYWRTSAGMELDTGAYVMALEAAAGVSPVVLGKPSPEFFGTALVELGLDAGRVAMIGDDIDNDVLGAQHVGVGGVLVRTGKFRADAVAAAAGEPDLVVADFAAAIDRLID